MLGAKQGNKQAERMWNSKHLDLKRTHIKKKKFKTRTIVETTLQKEHELGNNTTRTLHAPRNQQYAQANMEFKSSMLLTKFEPLRGLDDSKQSRKRRILFPKQKPRRDLAQTQRVKACKLFHEQQEVGNMPVNALPPWVHPQRVDPSLSSYTRGNMGKTPYVGKGKMFGPKQDPQGVVMVTGARNDVLANTLSPFGSWLWAINSAGMRTRSQPTVTARTPWTPSRELPITRKALGVSPVMFYDRVTPHSTPRTIATINVTSAPQGLETTTTGSRGIQDLPIDLIG